MTGPRPIYLDNQATTPVDPRVADAMAPYWSERFGNPHSGHFFGLEAREAVDAARSQVAALIGARADEIYFTSGATESNNLAIKGAARAPRNGRRHMVTCVTEHLCVLNSMLDVEDEGVAVTYLPVGADGLVDLEALAGAITDDSALVSVMAVQNEIGVIQPLAEIGRLARARGALFHTDAAQAAGKIPLDVEAMNIDLLSLTGHKLYGPMGCGALYAREEALPRLAALFSGGGQERGLRPGTVPAPLAVGLGAACGLAAVEMAEESDRLRRLRDQLLDRLRAGVDGIKVNGHMEQRIAGNLNISIPGLRADRLMEALPDIALSSGSACSSADNESSHVLRALGLTDDEAEGSIRIGLGRFTTTDEVAHAGDRLIAEINALRGSLAAAE